ncbi:BapA/Bap/LapF family prefix-like domain-containing protein [Alkalilimnicola ehrlichii MLHE-1]|uniref:Biofilm-associated protein BapA-like prefix-like domain-containing protein n=1 Tax=Alkalilimnicola ehrlichii (strain ATCC BAA-1101 / DSM 17681 / MLHE-1) TaxID=187272 RepID=Q0A6M6_ALKEH|nr:VCBS domain-containing protein [Alkalilimnicola ehrlichii]ABI57511.1 hypothetical protein Mlg_2169 [Alkalilimnicola ehrlichii MLHE-1]
MRGSDSITLVDKESGRVTEVPLGSLEPMENTVVKLPVGPEQVAGFDNRAGDLVLTLATGEEVIIPGFFDAEGVARNELVLEDSSGVLWWGQYETPWSEFAFAEINTVDDLVADDGGGLGAAALAGLLGAAALAAAAGSSSSSSSDDGPPDDDDDDDNGDVGLVVEITENTPLAVAGTASDDAEEVQVWAEDGETLLASGAVDGGQWSLTPEWLKDNLESGIEWDDHFSEDDNLAAFNGYVSVTDGEGNVSPQVGLEVPSLWPFDDVAAANLKFGIDDLEDLLEDSLELDDVVLQGGLLGGEARAESEIFTVGEGQVGAISFTASSGGLLALLDSGYEIDMVDVATGDVISSTKHNGGLLGLDLLGLLSPDLDISETAIPEGSYQLILHRNGGDGGLLSSSHQLSDIRVDLFNEALLKDLLEGNLDQDLLDSLELVGADQVPGNIITDVGAAGRPDIVAGDEPPTVWVKNGQGDWQAVESETTIAGQWGELTMQADGSYSYQVNEDRDAYGERESFTYKLVRGDEESPEAELAFGIGGELDEIPPELEGMGADTVGGAVAMAGLDELNDDPESLVSASDEPLPAEADVLQADEPAIVPAGAAEGATVEGGGAAAADGIAVEAEGTFANDDDSSNLPLA